MPDRSAIAQMVDTCSRVMPSIQDQAYKTLRVPGRRVRGSCAPWSRSDGGRFVLLQSTGRVGGSCRAGTRSIARRRQPTMRTARRGFLHLQWAARSRQLAALALHQLRHYLPLQLASSREV